MLEFKEWPKIPRFSKSATITEKIDGTNACVVIGDDGIEIGAQSRNRMITEADDNFGFARWVEFNKEDLLTLGPGHHYGEWWGAGIGRRYGLSEKRFSLFNVHRWRDVHGTNRHAEDDDCKRPFAPKCCYVVPILAQGELQVALRAADNLQHSGSMAAPDFPKPEGYVIYLERSYFKVVFGSTGPKSLELAVAA